MFSYGYTYSRCSVDLVLISEYLKAMESTTKPAKSSSNISEIVHRFAKVCRLRSIGVFPCENVNHNKDHSTEGSSDATEGTECDEQKIHPHPIDETLVKSDEGAAAAVIPKLLDSISALKLAYIQLQEAHVHFNPEKIQIADDLIVSEMKALSEIKRSFKGKQITKPISDFLSTEFSSACRDSRS